VRFSRGPRCAWADDSTLIITTGVEPLIRARSENSIADKIILARNVIRGKAANSYFSSGFVLLDAPESLPTIVAVLNAPSVVSVCDDLVLKGARNHPTLPPSVCFSCKQGKL
jgi:hypothetical protein